MGKSWPDHGQEAWLKEAIHVKLGRQEESMSIMLVKLAVALKKKPTYKQDQGGNKK